MHPNEIDFTGFSPDLLRRELTAADELGKNYGHALRAQLRRQRVEYPKAERPEG